MLPKLFLFFCTVIHLDKFCCRTTVLNLLFRYNSVTVSFVINNIFEHTNLQLELIPVKSYFNQIFSGSPSLTLTRTSTTKTASLTTYPPTMVPTTTHQHLGRPCVEGKGRSPMTSWAAVVHWPFCSTPLRTSPWARGSRLSTTWLKVGWYISNFLW